MRASLAYSHIGLACNDGVVWLMDCWRDCLVALRWGAVNRSQHGRNLVRNNGKKSQWFFIQLLGFQKGSR